MRAACASLLLAAAAGACRTPSARMTSGTPGVADARSSELSRDARRGERIRELELALAARETRSATLAGELAELHALEALDGSPSERDAHWVAAATYAHAASADLAGDARIAVLEALADSRLGFRDDAARRLAELPELATAQATLALLERLGIERALWPSILAAAHERARDTDELEAYRFAILALEGAERFGRALPVPEQRRLSDWILGGASVQFVCPESRTAFVPGLTRSPISGVPHFDYIAVERRKH